MSPQNCCFDRSWHGQSVLGLHGAADISFDEAASSLGQVLNHPITHVQTTLDQFRDTLLQLGATENVAAEYVEMWSSLARPDYTKSGTSHFRNDNTDDLCSVCARQDVTRVERPHDCTG